MPPVPISQQVQSIAGSVLGKSVAYGGLALFGMQDYRSRVNEGQHPLLAGASAIGSQALGMLMPWQAYLGLTVGVPLTAAATQAVIGGIRNHNQNLRLARTPFSHRFEHTDTSARAQQLGLQAIGSSWAHSHMGSEAALFAQRYGR